MDLKGLPTHLRTNTYFLYEKIPSVWCAYMDVRCMGDHFAWTSYLREICVSINCSRADSGVGCLRL